MGDDPPFSVVELDEPTDWIARARVQTEKFRRDLNPEFGLLTAPKAAEALGVTGAELVQLRQSRRTDGGGTRVDASETRHSALESMGGGVIGR